MNAVVDEKRVRDLMLLLEGQAGRYEVILEQVNARLAAVRAADFTAMQAAEERERGLVSKVAEQEGLRRQIMDAIGASLGMPAPLGRRLSAEELAGHLSPHQAEALRRVVARLKQKMTEVARANRLARRIAAGVLGHLEAVFSAVRQNVNGTVGYSGTGSTTGPSQARLIETLG